MYQAGSLFNNDREDNNPGRVAITNSSQTFTAPEDGYIFLKASIDDGYYDFIIDGVRFRHYGDSEKYDIFDSYETYPIAKGSVATLYNEREVKNVHVIMYFAPIAK
ncbi:hypothetical protein [Selenomonas ruminantium]|uniref:hypothetical protein n=1 Tax=Selenomonas ruminantium TaxID=971 RepID=UPI0026F10A18|nr:hypothetical protein [Selenomonas ruminantium]